MLLIGSAVRVVGGCAFVVIGLVILFGNRRITDAVIAGQRETLGVLLGDRRGWSDRLHSAPAFRLGMRAFVILFAIVWTGMSVGIIVTRG